MIGLFFHASIKLLFTLTELSHRQMTGNVMYAEFHDKTKYLNYFPAAKRISQQQLRYASISLFTTVSLRSRPALPALNVISKYEKQTDDNSLILSPH